MSQQLLGIDIGGSVIKAALFSSKGELLAQGSMRSVVISDSPGFMERDQAKILESVASAIREVLSNPKTRPESIAAIGITGFGNGLFLVDENGDPTRSGIGSTDSRAASIVGEWRDLGHEELAWGNTFQPFWSGQPLPLIEWVRRNDPDALRRARRILGVKDVVTAFLTGTVRTERTDLGSGGLYNPIEKRPAYELFDRVGLPEVADLIPENGIAASDEITGYVTQSAAKRTGLKVGIPVVAGTTDNLAVVIGSGIREPFQLSVVGGTWGLNQALSPNPVTDRSVFQSIPSHIDDLFLLVESTPNSMSNFDWYLRNLISLPKNIQREHLYDYCDEQYLKTQSDSSNTVMFIPQLFGSPRHPKRTGSLLGLTGTTTPQHILAAVYEGIVFEHRYLVERLPVSGSDLPVRISGGILRSKVWQQLYADVLGRTVEVPDTEEVGAKGIAMIAGVGIGLFRDYEHAAVEMCRVESELQPRPEIRTLMENRFERYSRVRNALTDFELPEAINRTSI
jgi:L-xylulokinase